MAVAVSAYKIAYMPVPKAACSSVKTALSQIDPEQNVSVNEIRSNNKIIHSIYPTMRFRPHRWENYEGWWRFTVVRDPLKRLLSVYSDRVVTKNELENSPKIRAQSRFPAVPDPDFFFQNIETYKDLASVVKHHALPVRLFIGPKPLRYERVFRVDQLSDLAVELERVTGTLVEIPKLNPSSEPLDFEALKPETQDCLAQFPREEYEHLEGIYESPFKN